MVEASVRGPEHGWHAWLDQLVQLGRVVAKCFDRESDDTFGRCTRDCEGVPVPAVFRLEVDHRELAGHKCDTRAERS